MSPSLAALIRKELIQAFRDRRMLSMLLMVPTLQLVIFGYAANLEFVHARAGRSGDGGAPHGLELVAAGRGASSVRPTSPAQPG